MSGRRFRLHGGPLASLVGPLLAAIAQARATPPAIRVIAALIGGETCRITLTVA